MNRLMITIAAAILLSNSILSSAQAMARGAILINFSSSHCPPCRAMQPLLEQLEQSGIPIRHVDVQAEQDLAQRYGVRQTPTFIVVVDGKEANRLVGMQTVAQLHSALQTKAHGPLKQTGATSQTIEQAAAAQTRLAPLQSFSAANALPASASAESMPSMSKADAIERARAATVRLKVYDGQGHGAGTGTIIDTHGEYALVLTCGHLFRETKGQGKVEVDLFVGGQVRTVAGNVVDYDADKRDIALVEIQPGFPVQPVAVISSPNQVRNGQAAFSYGCDRGQDPSRRDTRITGVNKYNQNINASNLEIQGAPIDGRSGGGLFDDLGRLVGVCNSADYQGDIGIYAGPGEIHWQLDRANLAHVYKRGLSSPPSSAPPADRLAMGVSEAALPAGLPASALQASAVSNMANQEVIVIVRDRNRPAESSRVMTVSEPTDEFMQMVQQYAR